MLARYRELKNPTPQPAADPAAALPNAAPAPAGG
jgi:hypothetical protein